LGLSGRVPHRVGAATKAALLDLLDQALEAGWPLRRACRGVELPQRRAHRWIARRARGQLADQPPGGSPVHRLLAEEAEQILALFDEWGELDRSHRKLAHRGSYGLRRRSERCAVRPESLIRFSYVDRSAGTSLVILGRSSALKFYRFSCGGCITRRAGASARGMGGAGLSPVVADCAGLAPAFERDSVGIHLAGDGRDRQLPPRRGHGGRGRSG